MRIRPVYLKNEADDGDRYYVAALEDGASWCVLGWLNPDTKGESHVLRRDASLFGRRVQEKYDKGYTAVDYRDIPPALIETVMGLFDASARGLRLDTDGTLTDEAAPNPPSASPKSPRRRLIDRWI